MLLFADAARKGFASGRTSRCAGHGAGREIGRADPESNPWPRAWAGPAGGAGLSASHCADARGAVEPHQPAAVHAGRPPGPRPPPRPAPPGLARAARDYAAVVEPPLKPHWPGFAEHQGAPWRRLRVGFLSPDFRTHSVMYFVEGLLAQLDRRQFEVFAFYLFPRDDPVTERVRRHADRFVRLAGLGAEQQAQAIRAQRIDILIDLAGHTGYNGFHATAPHTAPPQL